MQINKFPIKIILYKKGEMVYFSQLDLVHLLERALRRTELPLYYTQGFNAHTKISFSNGLKLGVKGKIETTLYFTENIPLKTLKKTLSAQLPKGLKILKVK